jgi:hypothetical protein
MTTHDPGGWCACAISTHEGVQYRLAVKGPFCPRVLTPLKRQQRRGLPVRHVNRVYADSVPRVLLRVVSTDDENRPSVGRPISHEPDT